MVRCPSTHALVVWMLVVLAGGAAKAAESVAPAARGHLVIVGGALAVEHEAVYRAVLDRIGPEGRVGVLPTASAIPAESGPASVEAFRRYASPGQSAELIDIRHDTPALAHDPAYVEAIARCDALWFTGGVQSRITAVFRPESGDTPAYEAIRGVLERGGVIAGTSAGAAMMSDVMIRWGNTHEALLVGRVDDTEDRGVATGPGMGFFPYGVIDQHFIARGRLGRLTAACELEGQTFGFGVDENCALVVDLAEHRLTVVGEPGVLFAERLGPGDAESQRWRLLQLRPGDEVVFAPSSGGGWRVASVDAGPPSAETVRQSLSGRPRSYTGPDAFVAGFEGDTLTLAPSPEAGAIREATLAEWEASREQQ